MLIGSIPNVVGRYHLISKKNSRKAPIDPCQTCINGVLYGDLVRRFPINDGCRSDGNGNRLRQIAFPLPSLSILIRCPNIISWYDSSYYFSFFETFY
jgi:hypothetical protein